MLVLKRKDGMWTNITIDRMKLERALKANEAPELRMRVYNIVGSDDKLRDRILQLAERLSLTNSDISRELADMVYSNGNSSPRVDIAFDDPDKNYKIERPERVAKISNGLL